MKLTHFYLVFVTGILSASPLLFGQELLEGHTDILFKYDVGSGSWTGNFVDGNDFENPDKDVPFDQASLPMIDQLYNSSTGVGDREIAISGDEFIGVAVGDPYWLLPQNNFFPRDYTWPGWRNDVTPNVFRSYQPADARINSAQRWITHTLKEVSYAGQSTTPGEFSAFQFGSFNSFTLWMATSDGLDSSDVFYLDENGHAHTNFAFSELGIYRVGLQASAILDSDGSTVTGDTEYITFAVGTLATWLAEHFSGTDLVDPLVTGMDADGEKDGVEISLEYAFNLNPAISDRHFMVKDVGLSGLPVGWVAEDNGAERLHIQYLQRKSANNPQIQYVVEFNDDLGDAEGWVAAGSQNTVSIDSTWERVTVVDTESVVTQPQRFVRVRVVVQESITY